MQVLESDIFIMIKYMYTRRKFYFSLDRIFFKKFMCYAGPRKIQIHVDICFIINFYKFNRKSYTFLSFTFYVNIWTKNNKNCDVKKDSKLNVNRCRNIENQINNEMLTGAKANLIKYKPPRNFIFYPSYTYTIKKTLKITIFI